MNEATAKRARRTGEREGFWGKRNERRKLTGDIDRPDHRATFGKNATQDRPIGRYFSMLPDILGLAFRSLSCRIATL